MARESRDRLITRDTLRAVDREYRDLVMSLRALAALLHDPSPGNDARTEWEPVLANILDAELNQLAVLMGDITAALRMETDATGPVRQVDLGRVLETAVRRAGSRVLVAVEEPVRVAAHPEIVSQAIISAVSLALRVADGRVTACTRDCDEEGVVQITIPVDEHETHWSRFDPRLVLLRRIVAAEGGRVSVEQRGRTLALRLAFPRERPGRAKVRPA